MTKFSRTSARGLIMSKNEHICRVEREQQHSTISIESNHPPSDGKRTSAPPFCDTSQGKGNEMEGSLARIDGTTLSSFTVFNKFLFECTVSNAVSPGEVSSCASLNVLPASLFLPFCLISILLQMYVASFFLDSASMMYSGW